ncbi:MAG: excinuclease ABC subunit C, partial [Candidatus Firestonebacteria bacterium]
DGGRGQLKAAKEALAALGINIPLISLAKREEEIYFDVFSSPLRLKKDSAVLHLLQYIRDEAHRFALSYHKTLRDKTTISSKLDNIKGIGEKTKRIILSQVRDVNSLSKEETDNLTGVSNSIKEKLKGIL